MTKKLHPAASDDIAKDVTFLSRLLVEPVLTVTKPVAPVRTDLGLPRTVPASVPKESGHYSTSGRH